MNRVNFSRVKKAAACRFDGGMNLIIRVKQEKFVKQEKLSSTIMKNLNKLFSVHTFTRKEPELDARLTLLARMQVNHRQLSRTSLVV